MMLPRENTPRPPAAPRPQPRLRHHPTECLHFPPHSQSVIPGKSQTVNHFNNQEKLKQMILNSPEGATFFYWLSSFTNLFNLEFKICKDQLLGKENIFVFLPCEPRRTKHIL